MVYIYIEPTEGNWYILVIEATEVNWYVLVFENISIPWTKLSWTYWRILVYICVMNLLKETGIVLNSVSAVLLCVTEIMHPIPEYFSRFKIQKSRKFWPIPGYFSSTQVSVKIENIDCGYFLTVVVLNSGTLPHPRMKIEICQFDLKNDVFWHT